MRVVATAGHVDHGKSSLVLALTGTDPDRFEEEKRRGLTIDLGFAHTVLPTGAAVSFVDVPGHVRFLRNMLAGVGGVDACLFVVAATEGWKPQSEEHLRILELLGLRHGVIALTKRDLVDDEWLEIAMLEVADHVAGTFLDSAPVIAVDSLGGTGLDDLRDALDLLIDDTPVSADRRRPRLWIDRVFAAKGSGTVVTGTLTGGELRHDQTVAIEPGGHSARIRSIQTLGSNVDAIGAGNRVALNLNGVGHDEIGRGHAVITPDRWRNTEQFDASLDVLAGLDHDVSRRGAYLAYIGSRELPVRMRVLGGDSLAPGTSGAVRLFLPDALPLLPGDRYVLRESGRDETVGGGEVLDIAPVDARLQGTPGSFDRTRGRRARLGRCGRTRPADRPVGRADRGPLGHNACVAGRDTAARCSGDRECGRARSRSGEPRRLRAGRGGHARRRHDRGRPRPPSRRRRPVRRSSARGARAERRVRPRPAGRDRPRRSARARRGAVF